MTTANTEDPVDKNSNITKTSEKNTKQKDPKDICIHFFDLIMKQKVIDAYDELTNGTLLEETEFEGLVNLKKTTLTFLSEYGEILGYELIKIKQLGKSLRKIYYNLLTESVPIMFFFSFYKGKKGWEIVSLNILDNHYHYQTNDIP